MLKPLSVTNVIIKKEQNQSYEAVFVETTTSGWIFESFWTCSHQVEFSKTGDKLYIVFEPVQGVS